MTRVWLVLACGVAAAALQGCIVVDDDDPGPRPLSVYEPCAYTSQCTTRADRCFEITVDYGSRIITDGTCSLWCRDDFDCPGDGACLSISGSDPICYERCFDDFDCPRGFACVDAIGRRSIDAVCLPF